jgi:uncharacterized protein
MSDMDEDVVYDLVRTMYENAGDVEHAASEATQLDIAVDSLGPISLHPGAQRYYDEQGVEVEE